MCTYISTFINEMKKHNKQGRVGNSLAKANLAKLQKFFLVIVIIERIICTKREVPFDHAYNLFLRP